VHPTCPAVFVGAVGDRFVESFHPTDHRERSEVAFDLFCRNRLGTVTLDDQSLTVDRRGEVWEFVVALIDANNAHVISVAVLPFHTEVGIEGVDVWASDIRRFVPRAHRRMSSR